MGKNWEYRKISDISEKIGIGPFGSSIKVSTFQKSGVPVISGQHLHGIKLDDMPGFNYISEEHARRLSNALVYRGDVVFTHAGNIGQVAYIPKSSKYDRYILSQRQFYLRCNTAVILPEFVTYYFKSREGQHRLLANSSSSGVPSISRPVSNLREIEIPVPSMEEQRNIIYQLTTLDDKIELNRRMNKTLEEIAQALFKHWFIDFEFPNEEGKPYKSSGGEMVDSELGFFPKSWGVEKFGKLSKFLAGATFSSNYWEDKGVPVVKIGSIKNGIVDIKNVSFVNKAIAEEFSKYKLSVGDILVGMTGYVGEVGLVPYANVQPLLNQRVIKIIPNRKSDHAFLYFYLRRDAVKEKLINQAYGSAQPNLSAGDLMNLLIPYPTKNVMNAYDGVAGSIVKAKLINEYLSDYLEEIKVTTVARLFR